MITIAPHIKKALQENIPVVALESTIITHGMPYPQNIETAFMVEEQVSTNGAIPATIGVINGKIIVGLSKDETETLGKNTLKAAKAAAKDLGIVVAQQKNAGTTVSATMKIAHLASIKVFATGGIGGVHRGAEHTYDISSDLTELRETPVIVVSAGCKSILDIPKTLEYLETLGVQIIGYNTNHFPAFHSVSSGIKLPFSTADLSEVAKAYYFDRNIGRSHGILLANPIPANDEIPFAQVSEWISASMQDLQKQNITGKEVTPFLLAALNNYSKGRSLVANISLIKNNARVAALLAKEMLAHPFK